jgi:pimeloyl-ACP methyl ester carboxylesterase
MNSPSFGGGGFGGLLAPLRQLSFWRMKQRARIVGASGMHDLLNTLRARSGDRARFHLMGHSFGCIVASAMITGPANSASTRPVNSLVLVQGALSHWSYCARIPYAPFVPGYFHRILDQQLVAGPIVTTRSRYDRAVGTFYPVGAGAAGQIDFAPPEPTRYGALGAFGAQGLGAAVADGPMLGADAAYDFRSHRVHNLEASDFIRKGGGISGAHSDIDGPEVAHAVWQAALTA